MRAHPDPRWVPMLMSIAVAAAQTPSASTSKTGAGGSPSASASRGSTDTNAMTTGTALSVGWPSTSTSHGTAGTKASMSGSSSSDVHASPTMSASRDPTNTNMMKTDTASLHGSPSAWTSHGTTDTNELVTSSSSSDVRGSPTMSASRGGTNMTSSLSTSASMTSSAPAATPLPPVLPPLTFIPQSAVPPTYAPPPTAVPDTLPPPTRRPTSAPRAPAAGADTDVPHASGGYPVSMCFNPTAVAQDSGEPRDSLCKPVDGGKACVLQDIVRAQGAALAAADVEDHAGAGTGGDVIGVREGGLCTFKDDCDVCEFEMMLRTDRYVVYLEGCVAGTETCQLQAGLRVHHCECEAAGTGFQWVFLILGVAACSIVSAVVYVLCRRAQRRRDELHCDEALNTLNAHPDLCATGSPTMGHGNFVELTASSPHALASPVHGDQSFASSARRPAPVPPPPSRGSMRSVRSTRSEGALSNTVTVCEVVRGRLSETQRYASPLGVTSPASPLAQTYGGPKQCFEVCGV